MFEADSEDFLLTLFHMNYSEDVTQDVTQDDVDKKIKEMIKSNPNVSTEEMAKILSLSTRTVKRHIKDMPDVQYVGSGYSGHWEIKGEK